MPKLSNKNKKGFSIGEVLLSVFILGVTMVAILSLYSEGLKNFQDERDSIIASMLAQEGIELARNVRDNNWARRDGVNDTDPATFANFGVAAGNTENDCRVSYDSSSVVGGEIVYNSGVTCAGGASYYNLYVNGGGFYTHNSTGATATKFRRMITLDYSNNDDMIVTSFVSWDSDNPDTTNCTTENKCVFSQSTLTSWGTGT